MPRPRGLGGCLDIDVQTPVEKTGKDVVSYCFSPVKVYHANTFQINPDKPYKPVLPVMFLMVKPITSSPLLMSTEVAD